MDKFFKLFGLACAVLIAVGVVAYGGYLYGTSHSGGGSIKVAEQPEQPPAFVPTNGGQQEVVKKTYDLKTYAGISACLNDRGFKDGVDFRRKSSGVNVVDRNSKTIDAQGRLEAWASARKTCGLDAV